MASILKVDTIQDQDGNNIINESAGTITIGKSGDTVQVASGAEFVGGGTQWQSSIVTGTTLSAVAGNGYWIDTTSNACTVTLPGSASVGDTIELVDYARTWNTNNVTINPNSLNFQGNSSPNPVYDVDGQSVRLVYSGATQGWIPTVDDDVTFETPQTYSVDFLVIAGGGGGGFDRGGGGGAGGYRNSYSTETSGGGGSSEGSLTFNGGTVYTITIGGGGAGATGSGANGVAGTDSSLSGSDITTITSNGGGGGGNGNGPLTSGDSGGSGGGGSATITGGAGSGTANQGYAGGAGIGSPTLQAGGGGGAGEAGNTDGQAYGGDGLSSSITGSAVTRGGGGGGNIESPSQPPGGDGGGGDGGTTGGVLPGNGTANTGGGGGGGQSSTPGTGGDGGSGVVILRMPTASYSGTTTGSPTEGTDGTDTILTFTGSGTYTG